MTKQIESINLQMSVVEARCQDCDTSFTQKSTLNNLKDDNRLE